MDQLIRMTFQSECHEDVGADEQENCPHAALDARTIEATGILPAGISRGLTREPIGSRANEWRV
jgi:hypothetical protein